jgi:hypothetical protein
MAFTLLLSISEGVGQNKDTKNIESVYESMSTSDIDTPSQKSLVEKSFDLDDPEVSSFMFNAMNSFPSKRGGMNADGVMACVLHVNPEKGIKWLVDHYADFSNVGRSYMVQSFRLLDCSEACEILSYFLDDNSTVVNKRSEAVSPGPYEHLRVCDYACNELYLKFMAKHKAEIPKLIGTATEIDERDRIVKEWKAWLKANEEVLKQKKKLSDKYPDIKKVMSKLKLSRPRNP